MNNFFIYYIDLSPGLINLFADKTNKTIVDAFRNNYFNWRGFFEKHKGFRLALAIVTKRGTKSLDVIGPTISRKKKIVDFSIFLPEMIESLQPKNSEDVNAYLDLVFSGATLVLSNYNVAPEEVEKIKEECKGIIKLV